MSHFFEGSVGFAQLFDISFQYLEFRLTFCQNFTDYEANEFFLNAHIFFVFNEGGFGVHHPEFGWMFAGFRFFSAKDRSEVINPTQTHYPGFQIKLARLRKVSFAEIEIRHFEKRSSAFTGIGCQNRGVETDKSVFIQILSNSIVNRVAKAQNRPLFARTEPQVAVIHQKFNAVFLKSNRVIFGNLIDLNIFDDDFKTAWRAFVFVDESTNADGRFLSQDFLVIENFFGNIIA